MLQWFVFIQIMVTLSHTRLIRFRHYVSIFNQFDWSNKAMLPAWAMKWLAMRTKSILLLLVATIMPARTYTNLPTTPLPASRRHGVGVPKSKQRYLGGFLPEAAAIFSFGCVHSPMFMYCFSLSSPYSHTVPPSLRYHRSIWALRTRIARLKAMWQHLGWLNAAKL